MAKNKMEPPPFCLRCFARMEKMELDIKDVKALNVMAGDIKELLKEFNLKLTLLEKKSK